MKHKLLPAAALVALALFSGAVARADSLTFSLTNGTATAAPGSTVLISGTVTAAANNTGLLYLNSDAYNFSSSAQLDDTPFFVNFPYFLSAGQSFTGGLFTLTLPASFGSISSGSFSILGGADGSALNVLGSANFSVSTTAATAVTPEPSSVLLCITGLLGVAAETRRRMAAF